MASSTRSHRDPTGASRDSRMELRRRAVASVLKGQGLRAVARALGVGHATVYRWLAQHQRGGWRQLDTIHGALTANARGWIYDTLTAKNPRRCGFKLALWNATMITELVRRKFDVTLPKTTLSRLLRELALSSERPWPGSKRRPKLVQRWLKDTHRQVRAQVRRQKALVFFADETPIHLNPSTTQEVWTRASAASKRTRPNGTLISATRLNGETRFMTVPGRVSPRVFIKFIQRLTHNADRPIFLLVDGRPLHKAPAVKRFAATIEDRFSLFVP